MMNKKPETTLQEDLKLLGLMSGDTQKALSEEAEDAGSGDEDGKEKDEKKDGDDGEAKKPAEKDDKDADDKAEKKMPAFMAKKDAEMNYAEQLEAAFDVVRNYYKLGEAEDAKLSVEDLRTVIDAYAFIVNESWDSDGEQPTKKPEDLPERGTAKVDLFPANENPVTAPATAGSPVAPAKDKGKYGERGRTATGASDPKRGQYAPRHQSAQTQAESLAALVSELHSIRDAVQESGPSAEQLALSEQLIAGFEAVRDTANEVATRVKAELAESKEVAKDDTRLEVTSFFESIFADANDILNAIAEGNVEIADAAEDLNTISEDLKKGLASLKDVG